MKISYFISAAENPLYEGAYQHEGSYMTFGQHSFLYDLILELIDRNIDFQIYVDNFNAFPLSKKLYELNVKCYNISINRQYCSDIIFFDSLSEKFLRGNNYKGFKIGIIHNYMIPCSEVFYKLSDVLLCMTPKALQKQESFYNKEMKHILIRQGIYNKRFNYTGCFSSSFSKVLFYSRMDRYKGSCYKELINGFLSMGLEVSLLGAGELFEKYRKEYKGKIQLLSHVPCYYINKIISQYDLVVSNGRGAMEGLSSNKPTIAAGVRYCGLIKDNNFFCNRDANFTGGFLPDIRVDLEKDIEHASSCFKEDPLYFRNMAINYLDVSMFLDSILSKYNEYVYT